MATDKVNKGELPNLLIIGTMKGGTSSLHKYLATHPNIFMSKTKELNFFNPSLNWKLGIEWYKTQFDSNYKIRGESSPNYSKWEGTAERIYGVLPNVKLIYVLREPVSRFVSQCNHQQVDPNEMVNKLRNDESIEIFTNGLYYKWYTEFTKFFPKENVLLIRTEDLLNNRIQILKQVFKFLNVDIDVFDFNSEVVTKKSHVTAQKLLTSDKMKQLNSNIFYKILKKLFFPVKDLLKPIQRRIFYRKRIIRSITQENKTYLKERYKDDLTKLRTETRISL